MRILYIAASSGIGGAQQALYNLVSGMVAGGHEIGVVLPDSDGIFCRKLEDLGCRIYASVPYVLTLHPQSFMPWKRLKSRRRLKLNDTAAGPYIKEIIEAFKPDLVHTNVGPLDIAAHECLELGVPHVWHLREYQRNMTFFPSEKSFRSMIAGRNNHCIAISEDIFRYWELDRSKDTVIYDGVIPSIAAARTDERKPYFLFAGRIEKTKAVLPMLKAFRQYRAEGGQCRLMIAGRPCGLYAHLCRLYARRFIPSGSVEFLGVCEDIDGMMSEATALLAPCKYEGFGFTVVEAMYRGCPVIGYDGCGIREQFDNGKRLCGKEIGLRFRTTAGFARMMAEVEKAGRELRPMTDLAEKTVLELYTVEAHSEAVERYYRQILSNE